MPSVATSIELGLRPHAPPAFVLEPEAYQIHLWTPTAGFVTHTAFVEDYPGPFPFATPPEYPGRGTPT